MKRTVFLLAIFIVSFNFAQPSNQYQNHLAQISQLRDVLEEASRNSQKVFVEEFTGLN